jgi:hypothetical protein
VPSARYRTDNVLRREHIGHSYIDRSGGVDFVSDGLPAGSNEQRSSRRAVRRTTMRTAADHSALFSSWIYGVAICLVAIAGLVAVALPAPAANVALKDDSAAQFAMHNAHAIVIAANSGTEHGYETTVRFRDGSTTVFYEMTQRTWRPGSRVLVIGGGTQ